MREKLFILLASLATAICLFIAGCGVLALIWQYQPVDEPYSILAPETHAAEYVGGGLVAVSRAFKITKPVMLIVERELIQHKLDNVIVRVEIPDTKVHYLPGSFKTQRMFEIPDGLPAGDYELNNRVCWDQNPIRRNCVDLPKLTIHFTK